MGRQSMIGAGVVLSLAVAVGCSKQGKQPERSGVAPRPVPAPAVVAETPPADRPPVDETTPTLADLRQTLVTTDDSRVRVLTVDQIATFGSAAKEALDDLLTMTRDAEPRVRWHAVRAIGLVGEDAIAAVPRLVELLQDEDPITAAQAAAAIRHVRVDDDQTGMSAADVAIYAAAIEPLAKATVHPDPRVRRAAVGAVHALEATPEKLAALLGKTLADSDPSVILPALHTLADMDHEAVPVLVETLKDPQACYWAAVALAEIGPEAAPAVAGLTTLAKDGQSEERMQAMLALAAIGPAAATATPVLIEALQSDDGSLRFAAAFALGNLAAKDAEPVLAKTVAGSDPFLAEIAAWARAKINPDDATLRAEALEKLRAGLSSDLPQVRAASTSGLSDLAAMLDPQGRRELAEAFLAMLADPDQGVGEQAGAALIRLAGDGVETLRGQLADANLRLPILEILAAIGPEAKAAVPEVMSALSDSDAAIRGEAAAALAAIGADAAPAIPRLEALLAASDEEPGTRYAAGYALGRIGPAAAVSMKTLRPLMESDDELMATVAVWAGLKIEPGNKEFLESAMPRLRKALRSDRDLARLEAAVALGEIGSGAITAIPILEVVEEDDPVRAVRAAAAAALAKIRGG